MIPLEVHLALVEWMERMRQSCPAGPEITDVAETEEEFGRRQEEEFAAAVWSAWVTGKEC
jgi:hypothetical protein